MRALSAAWEVKEAERVPAVLDGFDIHAENEHLADDEVQSIIQRFPVRLREEVDDDTDYFQAVFDDEIKTLKLPIAQTQRIANLLGVHGQAPTAAVPRETAKTSVMLKRAAWIQHVPLVM